MDLFDAIFAAGEAYINTKNDMKHNDDHLEVFFDNILKSKRKTDKMFDDEMREYDKRRKAIFGLFD